MDHRKKLLLLIDLMLIVIILLLYVLFFVPRDAKSLMSMVERRSRGIETYQETLKAKGTSTIHASDVAGIKQVDETSLQVPVRVTLNAKVGATGAAVTKKTVFKALKNDSSVKSTWYADTEKDLRYTKSGKHWIKSNESYSGTVDVLSLLDLDEAVITAADFRKDDGYYQIIVPAKAVGKKVLKPFLKDAKGAKIEDGQIVLSFHRRSKRLAALSSRSLMVKKSGDAKASEIKLEFYFSDYNRLDEEDWKVPDEITGKARSEAAYAGEKKKEYTLSMADLSKNDMEFYEVGRDLPAGAYTTGKRTGTGIITCLKNSDAKVRFSFNAGYGYEGIDTYKKGKEVQLHEGDRILLKGEKLSIVLKPVK